MQSVKEEAFKKISVARGEFLFQNNAETEAYYLEFHDHSAQYYKKVFNRPACALEDSVSVSHFAWQRCDYYMSL